VIRSAEVHADLESCLHDALPVPERQPGFLVNDLFFVAGSSAMARVNACGPIFVLLGRSGQLRRRHTASYSRGTTRAAKRNADEDARKLRLRRVFVAFRPLLFIARPRGARSGVRRCPPSLFSLWLSQRRRVRGSQPRWEPNYRARVT